MAEIQAPPLMRDPCTVRQSSASRYPSEPCHACGHGLVLHGGHVNPHLQACVICQIEILRDQLAEQVAHPLIASVSEPEHCDTRSPFSMVRCDQPSGHDGLHGYTAQDVFGPVRRTWR